MVGPKKIQVIIAFAALYIIWGSTYLGILFAIQTIPPFLMGGLRYLLAGAIMLAMAWAQGTPGSTIGSWRNAAIIGACLILVGNGGLTIAEKYVPTGLASLIVATVPIYMILLGWISGMSPRPQSIIWLGLVGGFAGVALLLGPALRFSGEGANHPAIGMSILLFSSFIWSVGSLYSRRATHQAASSPFLAAAQQMLCGGALLLLTGTITGEWPDFHPSKISILSIGAFVYLVLIGAVVGFTAYIWLLHHCDPAKVATYAYESDRCRVARRGICRRGLDSANAYRGGARHRFSRSRYHRATAPRPDPSPSGSGRCARSQLRQMITDSLTRSGRRLPFTQCLST